MQAGKSGRRCHALTRFEVNAWRAGKGDRRVPHIDPLRAMCVERAKAIVLAGASAW